jgi:hypothetical protein
MRRISHRGAVPAIRLGFAFALGGLAFGIALAL